MGHAESSSEAGERAKRIVHRSDLPLSCPTPDTELWNMHPRVYLPIADSGYAVCPYCGAEFVLQD